MSLKKADVVVVGGGIVGASIALELRRRKTADKVILLEKEVSTGLHASGRNSGVLHAGFYYTEDSFKAKFCRDGNSEWRKYCKEKSLPMNECGKLVVARNESERQRLHTLLSRGKANGVDVSIISEIEAKKIEPSVKTYKEALWSPTTTTIDPKTLLHSLVRDCKKEGVEVVTGRKYLRTRTGSNTHLMHTTKGDIEAKYIVNAAGLYADKIAKPFGFGKKYTILPFKGLYMKCEDEKKFSLNTHVYPVPDLRNPFLGVHYTATVDGKTKIGPTAIPALWREHYTGLKGFKVNEMLRIGALESFLFFAAKFPFRELAWEEVKKYYRPYLLKTASTLAGNPKEGSWKITAPGVRAQLVDVRKRTLVMDFLLEGDGRSMHVLNAVSPAFTCAFPFARYVCDRIHSVV